MSPALLATAGCLLLLGVSAWGFERQRWNIRTVATLSALVGFAAISRIPFLVIPGAQPTTAIVILTGCAMGPLAGCAMGAGAAFVSNVFLGQGPWTPWQMLAWGLCGGSAGLLRKFFLCEAETGNLATLQPPLPRLFPLVAFGVVWGFLFGWILNVWSWLAFVYPHTWTTFFASNALSLWHDTLHATGNAIFLFFAARPFFQILFSYAIGCQKIPPPLKSRKS